MASRSSDDRESRDIKLGEDAKGKFVVQFCEVTIIQNWGRMLEFRFQFQRS